MAPFFFFNSIIFQLTLPLIHIYDIMIHCSIALIKGTSVVDKFIWKSFSFSFSDQFMFWPVRCALTCHVIEKDPFLSFNFVSNKFITYTSMTLLWIIHLLKVALILDPFLGKFLSFSFFHQFTIRPIRDGQHITWPLNRSLLSFYFISNKNYNFILNKIP